MTKHLSHARSEWPFFMPFLVLLLLPNFLFGQKLGRRPNIMIVRLAAQLLQAIAKLNSQIRVLWICVEVVHFIRIGFEVVQLISILSEILDVLVPFSANAATRRNIFVRGVFVVFVEPILAPLD